MNILTRYLLSLSNIKIAGILLFFFAVAIFCTLGSVASFVLEMMMSGNIMRARMHLHVPGLPLLRIGRRSRP